MASNQFRRTLTDNPTALFTAFGPEVNDPIRFGDQVQVVFDHNHGVTRVNQSLNHFHQSMDVRHMETDGWFLQDEEF